MGVQVRTDGNISRQGMGVQVRAHTGRRLS